MSAAYIGSELEIFAAAANWKSYVARVLAPFVGPRVLEIGAGIGSNVPYLHAGPVRAWTSVEPDGAQAARIANRIAAGELPATCRVVTGDITKLDAADRFDTILYLDVLEHIEEDAAELVRARRHLAPSGHLVVLAPAHPFLFSPFDAAIGHWRRYDRASLAALDPPDCRLMACLMLDSAGFFASLANAVLLRSAQPSPAQIALWDKFLVPASRLLDPALGYRFGKSVLAVWRSADS